jgi:hypothetical protein
MEKILTFLLVSISISYMWSFSTIFNPVRNFVARIPVIKYPMICPECSSFWFGLLTCLFLYNPFQGTYPILLSIVLGGLITHLIASLIYKKLL